MDFQTPPIISVRGATLRAFLKLLPWKTKHNFRSVISGRDRTAGNFFFAQMDRHRGHDFRYIANLLLYIPTLPSCLLHRFSPSSIHFAIHYYT